MRKHLADFVFGFVFLFVAGQLASQAANVEVMAKGNLLTQVQQQIPLGMSREAAEAVLDSLDVKYHFVTKNEFPQNNLTEKMMPPHDCMGALVAMSRPIEKRGLLEKFLAIVVYIGRDARVSKVATQTLTTGP